MYEIFTYVPGTNIFSEKRETVFTRSDFFRQGLDWLSKVARGTVSALGKQTSHDSPVGRGRWLPNCATKSRRFYKHGDAEHLPFQPSREEKAFLKPDIRKDFDSAGLRLNAPLQRILAEDISYQREILSSIKNIITIVEADEGIQRLSAASRAALVSLDVALKDAMSTISHMHANFMLACRDKFLQNMENSYFIGRPGLSTAIRTAPLDGPLLSSDLHQRLLDIQKEVHISTRNPTGSSRPHSRRPKKAQASHQRTFQPAPPPAGPTFPAPQGPPFLHPPPTLPAQPFRRGQRRRPKHRGRRGKGARTFQ